MLLYKLLRINGKIIPQPYKIGKKYNKYFIDAGVPPPDVNQTTQLLEIEHFNNTL